jgi:hypothetical protein
MALSLVDLDAAIALATTKIAAKRAQLESSETQTDTLKDKLDLLIDIKRRLQKSRLGILSVNEDLDELNT